MRGWHKALGGERRGAAQRLKLLVSRARALLTPVSSTSLRPRYSLAVPLHRHTRTHRIQASTVGPGAHCRATGWVAPPQLAGSVAFTQPSTCRSTMVDPDPDPDPDPVVAGQLPASIWMRRMDPDSAGAPPGTVKVTVTAARRAGSSSPRYSALPAASWEVGGVTAVGAGEEVAPTLVTSSEEPVYGGGRAGGRV